MSITIAQFTPVKITLAHAEKIAANEGIDLPNLHVMRVNRDRGFHTIERLLRTGAKLKITLRNNKRVHYLYPYHYAAQDIVPYLPQSND